MNEQAQTLAAYFRLMNHNGAAQVYRHALAAGLLDALATISRSPTELAAECNTDSRATSLVLEALAAVDLVTLAEGRWSLTPLARGLIGGAYRDLGDPYWAHLPQFLKTGQPWIKMDAAAESEAHYQGQAAALAWMLGPAADAAAQILSSDATSDEPSILDLGAGSAIWSLTIARRNPAAKVTAVDWPAVLAVAQQTAAMFGLADRLTTIAGNYHEAELPSAAFDLAIAANVTHLETAAGNRSLFAKAHAALKRTGRLVIVDVFPGQNEGDLNRTLYAVGLALRTQSGRVFTPEELESLLVESGFQAPTLISLPAPPYAMGLLVAEKA